MMFLLLCCCWLVAAVVSDNETTISTPTTDMATSIDPSETDEDTQRILDLMTQEEEEHIYLLRRFKECTSKKSKFVIAGPLQLECMCDLECIQYGDCCIDIMIKLGHFTKQTQSRHTCMAPSSSSITTLRDINRVADGYYMIRDATQNDGTTLSCNINIFLPVTCRATGHTYINMQCANLNKEVQCIGWITQFECSESPPRICNSYHIPPYFAELRYCDKRRFGPIKSECHPDYNYLPDLRACQKYNLPVQGPYGVIYRNVFCYKCNWNGMSFLKSEEDKTFITMLTDFSDLVNVDEKRCNGTMAWMDTLANKCRPILCNSHKTLRNGECEYDKRTVEGNSYQMKLKLFINTNYRIPFFQQWLHNIHTRLSLYIWSTDYHVITSDQNIENKTTSSFDINIWFTVNVEDIEYHDFENRMLQFSYFDKLQDLKSGLEANLNEVTQPDSVYRSYSSNVSLGICCSQQEQLRLPEDLYEPITHQLKCSYIVFDRNEFEMTDLSAYIPHLNLTFDRKEYSVYKEQLRVCFRNLLEKTNFTYSNETVLYSLSGGSDGGTIAWYLSIVLVSISLIALTLTCITYVRFKELRTPPGKNNMALIVTLFLAQLTLTVGADKVDDVAICPYIGMLIHYLWLSMLLWMNVCSFHMFKVFVLQTLIRVDNTNGVRQLLKYSVYANGTPILIIVATVVVKYQLSNGRDLGYGGRACYLSTNELVAFCFVLPLALVVLSNIVFFLWAIITIHRIDQTSRHDRSGERNNIYIYVRLSVVTGVFWLVAILTNVVNSEVLQCISIILNASQGVFLFWCIVLNKTVISKWTRQCATRESSTTPNESTPHTISSNI